MEKYYVAAWILSLSFLGLGSLVMDMVFNKEDEEIVFSDQKPKANLSDIVNEYSDEEDSFEDVSLENVEENYFADSDLGL